MIDNHVVTKAYVDEIHNDNERIRRDLRLSFYNEEVDLVKDNQDNDFNHKKITNINSITANREPTSNNELANKKYFDESIGDGNVLRFNQTLENYLKISVGDETHILTKYDKTQITDTTNIKTPNTGGFLLQQWNMKCSDKFNNVRISSFIRSTNTSSPTGDSGATSLLAIGDSICDKFVFCDKFY